MLAMRGEAPGICGMVLRFLRSAKICSGGVKAEIAEHYGNFLQAGTIALVIDDQRRDH
jgi:hypothetical protein